MGFRETKDAVGQHKGLELREVDTYEHIEQDISPAYLLFHWVVIGGRKEER